jgi:hypothetical protein
MWGQCLLSDRLNGGGRSLSRIPLCAGIPDLLGATSGKGRRRRSRRSKGSGARFTLPARTSAHRAASGGVLGHHRLLTTAFLISVDPPYNVQIDGHVSWLGRAHHAEFAMASGEMCAAEFTAFLEKALTHHAAHSTDGTALLF